MNRKVAPFPPLMEEALQNELGDETILWADAPLKKYTARGNTPMNRRVWWCGFLGLAWMALGIFMLPPHSPLMWLVLAGPIGITLVGFLPMVRKPSPWERHDRLFFVVTPQRTLRIWVDPKPNILSVDASAVEAVESRVVLPEGQGGVFLKCSYCKDEAGHSLFPVTYGCLASVTEVEAALREMMGGKEHPPMEAL